jgi:hypothetical protein
VVQLVEGVASPVPAVGAAITGASSLVSLQMLRLFLQIAAVHARRAHEIEASRRFNARVLAQIFDILAPS